MDSDVDLYRKDRARISKIEAIVKQMADLLVSLRTYDSHSPLIQKSLRACLAQLTPFLKENDSLTLLVQENGLISADRLVYSSDEKRDSLAFALYRDGIRVLTFKSGVTEAELGRFIFSVHEGRETDPKQADLVTILWEKDLPNISFRTVDAHFGSEDKEKLEKLNAKCTKHATTCTVGAKVPGSGFFTNELGLSPPLDVGAENAETKTVSETDIKALVYEMLAEDDHTLLRRCCEICLEMATTAGSPEQFSSVVGFLGRACEWLVTSGDFVSACSIVTDLRSLAGEEGLAANRQTMLIDTVAQLGERRKIALVGEHLHDLSETRVEEIYGYLAQMTPVAVDPLCELLAEAKEKAVRYLLCRALSIVGHKDPAQLTRFLQDRRWFVVRNMILIVGMMEDPSTIEILQPSQTHPDARVRKELARALGRIGSAEGLELLQALLDDEDKTVRVAGVKAIRDIGGDPASTMLHDNIKDKKFRKRPLDERREMMVAYGAQGLRSLELLKAVLDGKVHRWDKKTRACAAYGVAVIDDDEARLLLRTLADEGKGPIRYAAAEAYASLDDYTGGTNE
jgi:hypothetical protein